MGIESLVALLIVGAVAGFLAEKIVKVPMGLLGNIVTGIVGAYIAGLLLPRLGLTFGGGVVASVLHATLGAVILLFAIKLIRKR